MKCRLISRNSGIHKASVTYPRPDERQGQELAKRPFEGPLLLRATLVLHFLSKWGAAKYWSVDHNWLVGCNFRPLFSNKVQSSSSITLLENRIVESTESKVAKISNKYFANIAESLV